jgi:H-NS histone family
MIEFFDLKPFELFGTVKMQTVPPKKMKKSDKTFKPAAVKKTKNPPKYRDPASGATWTGMGKQPYWIEGNRDDYLIENLQDKPKRITQNNKEEHHEREEALH